MSYDIYITDKETGETIEFDEPHQLAGCTYALGGTLEAYFSITYNYEPCYSKTCGFNLRDFDGKSIKVIRPLLQRGIETLGTRGSTDYWEASEGNAGAALKDLLELCDMCKDENIVKVD